MAKSNSLTTDNIIPILKKSGFTTKEDVREIVLEATDAILSGIERLLEDYPKKKDLRRIFV